MNIRPLQDRVVINPSAEEQKSAGGIVIPDTASKEKPMEGTVMAIGPGKVNADGKAIPMSLKKGDKVLFGKYSGTEVKVNGTSLVVMREDDIMGVIED